MAAKMEGLLRFSVFQRMLGIGGIQSRLNHCRYFLCSRNKFIQSLSSSAYLERNHPGGRPSIRVPQSSDEGKLIWEGYVRNHKGALPPRKTRLRCKRNQKKNICGNPCPICKNDIELSHQDTQLLQQFICRHTGKILPATKTGLCRLQQKKLTSAIDMARDCGYIPFTLPRHYQI